MLEVLPCRMANVPDHKEVAVRRTALTLVQTLVLGIAVWVLGPQSAYGQQGFDPRVADLVRAGQVRVGLGLVPTFATKDPATGELRGVAMELARALAARLGIAVVPVEYPSPPSVLEGLKTGAWDVGFLGIDPARLAQADFSPPYLQVDSTYLVPAGSAIRTIADADHQGVRIAVTRNSVEDFALARMLKGAALVHVETISAGFDVLRAGDADVLAVPRPTALQFALRLPGSHVLEDRFHAVFHGIAVPKGQAGRLAYVSDFIEEAKASGLVQQAVERAGLHGVQVAPAGNPSPR
jgi:polar amino acid transport system substrate-binding protein